MATLECAADVQKAETLQSSEHLTGNHQKLQVDFDNQECCDVTLISADDEFKVMAHRSLLASTSKYFQAMFGGRLRESEEREIKLNQFDGRTLKAILDFIYKGKVEVTPETAASVLIGAQVVEIKALEELCCSYMIKNLDVSDCLGISQFAKLYNFDQLNSAAVLFACENFVTLTGEEEYLSLSLEDLCDMIAKDDLRVPCEGDVLRGILAWISHEKEEREQHFEELLSFVRFPLLSREYVEKFIEEEVDSADMQRMIRLAQDRTVDKDAICFSYKKCNVRNFKDVIVVIRGFEDPHTDLSVAFYYSGSNEWVYTKWPAPPHCKQIVKCAFLGKSLLATGGTDGGYCAQPVDSLNLETLEWKKLPSIARAYSFFTLNGAIYSTGDHRFWKLVEPFEKWVRVRIPVEKYPRSLDLCATYKNLFYFKYGSFHATYDSTDGSFNLEKIPAVELYENMYFEDAVHISRHMGSDYLVEHAKKRERDRDLLITHVYDLNTSECVRTFSHEIKKYKRMEVFGHGDHFIRYQENIFSVYDLFGNQVGTLPPLIDDRRNIDVAFGNSNL